MLWQGEKNYSPNRWLSYMYWPVMGTLLEGFRHAHAEVEVVGPGVGFSLAWHRAIAQLDRSGDIFIWVGTNGKLSQPWRQLRRRGVRTVYYNTEPMFDTLCDRYRDTVDELWDFSFFNIERCARSAMRPATLRFVPPGYLRASSSPLLPTPSVLSSNGAAGSASDSRLVLVFFGLISRTHPQRRKCFGELQRRLGARLVQRYDVWNASAFDAFMASSELFVNLHKFCARRHPVTFRNSVLLNAGKLILSERAHCLDEREYRGMITFVDVERLAEAYEAVLAAGTWRTQQRRAHEKFSRRFSPKKLFTRAAIYRDLGIGPQQPVKDGVMSGVHYSGGAKLTADECS